MRSRVRVLVPLLLVAAVVTWLVLRRERGDDGAIVASGVVEATQAELGFQGAGRIETVVPREGDDVAAGERLAALDAGELDAARAGAAAQLDAAQARLRELERGARRDEVGQADAGVAQAREREQNARREADRAERLFQGGALSQQQRDQAKTALDVAVAALAQAQHGAALVREGARPEQVEAQRAVVKQAQANLERADAALEGARIVAPFAGRVTIRHREPGETVAPGAPVLTLLNPGDRWVRIYVPEDQIGRVRVGEQARITADTYPDKTYTGEVVHIGSEAEFTPRNVQTPEERTRLVYPVKVRIAGDTAFDLKPGVPADVRIETPVPERAANG